MFIRTGTYDEQHCHKCSYRFKGSGECQVSLCQRGYVGYFTLETADDIEKHQRALEPEVELVDDAHPKHDKKYDQGKPKVFQMKKDFGKALLAVADVTSYGIEKYNQPGSWKLVENAYDRYEDALGRHDLQLTYEQRDTESKRLHAVHRAWNALACLQLILEEGEV